MIHLALHSAAYYRAKVRRKFEKRANKSLKTRIFWIKWHFQTSKAFIRRCYPPFFSLSGASGGTTSSRPTCGRQG